MYIHISVVGQSYPNDNIPGENAPKMEYFRPASVENSESLFKAAIT